MKLYILNFIEKSINKISLEIVVDDLKCCISNKDRIIDSLENTSLINKGKIKVNIDKKSIFYSTSFACPQCDFTIQELSTKLFSPLKIIHVYIVIIWDTSMNLIKTN